MKMDKMFAGLVAFVAGVALSAGSAAADGYMVGDPANMKLVPYYETGNMKATIIGIQNMSTREQSTVDVNQLVQDIQDFIDGEAATAAAAAKIDGVNTNDTHMDDRDTLAAAEEALDDAMMDAYTEHVRVGVDAYKADGTMMGSASLCLDENQFGHVVLQGPADMGVDSHMGAVLSVMDGDIHEYGYVKVTAGIKYTSCDPSDPLKGVNEVITDGGTDDMVGDSKIAAWTIIQDVGDGFFGTEVPTTTISMMEDAEENMVPDCYGNDGKGAAFNSMKCGLIPERSMMGALDNASTTNNTTAYARYDAGDESMVYVWLAAGGDDAETRPSGRRALEVAVRCSDGMMVQDADIDGNSEPIMVAAPGMLTMIDPNGPELGAFTGMCAGDRGVLEIMMPNGSHAGTVFTHITQMGGHYRMNFPGYSMDSEEMCTATSEEMCM